MAEGEVAGGEAQGFEYGELLKILGGVAGLLVLALLSVVLSAEVSVYARERVFASWIFWALFGASLFQAFIIVILAYAFRHYVGTNTFRFLGAIQSVAGNLEDSKRSFVETIIPSFSAATAEPGELPVHPPIIDQLRKDLRLMEEHLKGFGIVQRGVITFGEAGAGMLLNFFEDEQLAAATLREIRFMGTGRGVVGPTASSYQFIEHLKAFFEQRGTRFPLFDRFAIIGCREAHDQFCSKVLCLLLLRWIRSALDAGKIKLDGQVRFEVVYPHQDVFPALVAMGEQKGLVAVPIGYRDRHDLAVALPIGIQIVSAPIKVGGGSTVNLTGTVGRIKAYFDEVFSSGGAPEVWSLDDRRGIAVRKMNLEVLQDGLAGVTSLTKEEKDEVTVLLDGALDPAAQAALAALPWAAADRLAQLFIKASRMEGA